MPCVAFALGILVGITFPEARGMIKKAKAGDVQTALLIADTIGFEVQMGADAATTHSEADGTDGHDNFDFM